MLLIQYGEKCINMNLDAKCNSLPHPLDHLITQNELIEASEDIEDAQILLLIHKTNELINQRLDHFYKCITLPSHSARKGSFLPQHLIPRLQVSLQLSLFGQEDQHLFGLPQKRRTPNKAMLLQATNSLKAVHHVELASARQDKPLP